MRIVIYGSFAAQVQKDRASRLVVRGVYKVALLVCGIGVFRIAVAVLKVVDLLDISDILKTWASSHPSKLTACALKHFRLYF